MLKFLFYTVLAIVAFALTIFICNQYPTSVITCKVLKLQQQQKISGSSEYQGNFIIHVGCEKANHTIRRKEKIEDVKIFVIENTR